VSGRVPRAEQRRLDAIGWLHRHRDDFPDGFTAEALEKLGTWELARYDGLIRLPEPREVMVVQMPEKDRRALKALGLHDFAKGTIYMKEIPVKHSLELAQSADRIPRSLGRSRSSAGRLLARLAREGVLVALGHSKPRAYRFTAERAVFGVTAP
jgi:hypothetical protein